MTAPHAPYIRAVVAQLDETAELRGLGYDYPWETGEEEEDEEPFTLMEALIAFVDPADPRLQQDEDYDGWWALAWCQTTGWSYGRLEDGALLRSAVSALTTATVPPPAEVATAWTRPGPLPHQCGESPPAEGPLSEPLAAAVAVGDLDEVTAARLAAVTG